MAGSALPWPHCPAYRLALETPGVDILTDISAFWTWLHAHLPSAIQTRWPHLTANLIPKGQRCGLIFNEV
jgi:hypothetical protein